MTIGKYENNWSCDVCPDCGCCDITFIFKNDDKEILWYEVPKAASTSIRHALYSANFERVKSYKELNKDKYDNYKKISIIRSPYSRLYANYRMFCVEGQISSKRQIRKLFNTNTQPSFHEFIKFFDEDGYRNHHYNPCVNFWPRDHEELDIIIKFEELLDDWKNKIQDEFKFMPALPHKNRASKNRPNYKDIYNKIIIGKINKVFSEDIEIGNYKSKELL